MLQVCLAGGSYVVDVNVHSYWNPSGRCDECQEGPEPGCCDETEVRPADDPCPITAVCDTIIFYCAVPLGDHICAPTSGLYSKLYNPNANSLDFDAEGTLIGTELPLIIEGDEPWRVSNIFAQSIIST